MAPALRKQCKEGIPYERFPDVQAKLEQLYLLSDNQLVARCGLPTSDDGYVPTQCVVHFMRHRRDNPKVFTPLYRILATRARKIRPAKVLPMHEQPAHEAAFDAFINLLLSELEAYQERLDFFEVNFKGAYANLILDAQRHLASLHAREVELLPQVPEVDDGLSSLEDNGDQLDDMMDRHFDFASCWGAALERMTLRQRLIVKMRSQGLLIEPKDPNDPSIPKLLNITPKTVRSDLTKALAIFKQLSEEGVSA